MKPIKLTTLLLTVAILVGGVAPAWGSQNDAKSNSYLPENVATGDRAYWLESMLKVAHPVLSNLAADNLRASIPIGRSASAKASSREFITHMESVGRTIAGIAPWLELGPDDTPEGQLRAKYIDLTCRAIANSVDPNAKDYFNSTATRQILVNSAFLIQGLLRAPTQLWGNLDELTRQRLFEQWKSTRTMVPGKNNWYFFCAMVECGLKEFAGEWDFPIVERAINSHKEWYVGDGIYGDGEVFHLDYYNSYVIQPMMMQVLRTMDKFGVGDSEFHAEQLRRFRRFAAIQERMIAPDGTYPLIGRSITYRLGAFQVLAQCAQEKLLPEGLSEGQVRAALTAAMHRVMDAEGTFDKDGWLTIGVCGDQPELGDTYLSTPCVYLTSLVYLPLGLPAEDSFWRAPAEPWTGCRAFAGEAFPIDTFLKKPKAGATQNTVATPSVATQSTTLATQQPIVAAHTPVPAPILAPIPTTGAEDRAMWVSRMIEIVGPVLENMSCGELRKNMPVETPPRKNTPTNHLTTHLEALGRTVVGIAPWLELGPDDTPEGQLRAKYIRLTCEAIKNGIDPNSPDYLNFTIRRQPLVDAAFLCQGMLRAPKQIWGNLDEQTKENFVREMNNIRKIKPLESNWLLFAATVEAALLEFTGEWNPAPVEYALMRFKEWYKGDGWYADGPELHIDYYNSYVIHPMLYDVLATMQRHGKGEAELFELEKVRLRRYAQQLELLISPDGAYPVVGRSIAYRFGSMQVLAQSALLEDLPATLTNGSVRAALTAVINRHLAVEGNFDESGWLTLGFAGHQIGCAETYISTGSLYLCTPVFLPLGLPADHPFWTSEWEPWSGLKAWTGSKNVKLDKAIKK